MALGTTDLPVVVMRGGTSKGIFVPDEALPPEGEARDAFLLALMGSPDPMQLDGLGGGVSSTSKVVAVRPSRTPGCDVDYMVYQVGIDRAMVDASGNCGNLTAAVAPYAIDEGLVPVSGRHATVVLRNLNTDRTILAHLTVRDGRFDASGEYHLDGVPGTGSPIVTEYLDPAGSVTGKLFPTSLARQEVRPEVGEPLEVSIVDVTSPVVIVRADDLSMVPTTDPAAINADRPRLERLESIRIAAATAAGMASSLTVPRVAVVGRPADHVLADGTVLSIGQHDLVVRSTSLQRAHHAIPLTTAMCVAAAARLPGTIAEQQASSIASRVRLGHPKGVAEIGVNIADESGAVDVVSVSVVRTARRLLAGIAHVPI